MSVRACVRACVHACLLAFECVGPPSRNYKDRYVVTHQCCKPYGSKWPKSSRIMSLTRFTGGPHKPPKICVK